MSFASTTSSTCSISGSTVTLVAVGTCTIQATQAGNGNYAAATPVSQTFLITISSQTIAFGTIADHPMGSAPFNVTATASSGLAVIFASITSSNCSVVSGTVSLLAAGTCTIQASQSGNANYAAAPAVSQSFQIIQASQSMTFGTLTGRTFGTAPFILSATASSGLPVSFASTTSTTCSVSGTTVTLVAVGTCTIQATQSGNANYAAASAVNQSFQITPESQSITFGTLSSQAFGTGPFSVSAAASSGLTVSFTSTTSTTCSVTGAIVTLVAVGTCTIQANQSGNGNYSAAASVSQSFQITLGSQTISFGTIADHLMGTAPFTVSGTASSGLSVSFASTTLATCIVSGTAVSLVAAGTCTIQAMQAGNAGYSAAPVVNQSFYVTQGGQTISFAPLSNVALGTAPFSLSGTASSGLPVSFASTTTTVCTLSGTMVTLAADGTCTIQATQPGNANYIAAIPVNQSFQVTQGSETISFGALANQVFGVPPFVVTASASSSLTVNLSSLTPTVCAVSGATVTLVGVGTCTIQATQAGNATFAAAPSTNQSFQVTQGSQTISFASLGNPLGNTPLTLSASASSGLAVSFTSTTPSVCSVSGAAITPLTVGNCTIQASQTGNANYSAAAPVNQTLSVTAGIATLAVSSLSFGNTLAGKSSAIQKVTFQNTGNAALTITSITPAGSDATNYQYTLDPTLPCPITPATLGAGASCALDIAFLPVSAGMHASAQLAIVDNNANVVGATQTVTLSGMGIVLSTIAVSASGSSVASNGGTQVTAIGTYSDNSTADLTDQVAWASSAPMVVSISASGMATGLSVGQTNISATLRGVTSNSFQLTVVAGTQSTISAIAGSGQAATVGMQFANTLQAMVKDSAGNAVGNAPVIFASPSSGPGGPFANGLATYNATTNSSGIATSAALTANSTAGTYFVTATATGIATPANFSMTNVKAPQLSIIEAPVGIFVQGQNPAYTLTVANAAGAGPTSGTVTVSETVPSGFALVGMEW